jgi:hypothetical protein
MIHSDDIKWEFVSRFSTTSQYHGMCRDNALGVQYEYISNRTKCGTGITKTKKWFFIDNDDREFLTEEALIEAYNEKFQFEEENPEHEVKYVRVVLKRDATK